LLLREENKFNFEKINALITTAELWNKRDKIDEKYIRLIFLFAMNINVNIKKAIADACLIGPIPTTKIKYG
jgi:RNase P subunit RPR2